MFESGQTSTRQPLDFSFVSRSLKRYSTKSSSSEHTTRLVEHYTACEHAQSKSTKSHTNKSSKWRRARSRTQQNKATNGRTKERKWSDQETNLLIDLLEEHTCLWDVYSKQHHLRNARERAYEKMKGERNIELANIKTKITNLRSPLGRKIAKSKAKKSGQARSECYKSSWTCWDRLQFLVPVIQAGKTKDTLLYQLVAALLCLLYTSPSPRDLSTSRMPSSA